MSPRIVLLFHELDRARDLSCYVVFHLAEIWRESGLDVQFVFGARDFVPADLALLHVDLSVVPSEYLELADRYPVALNRRATDIRKSCVSRHLVRPGDAWDGPVIVKTDLNYGGAPERSTERRRIAALSRLRRRVLATTQALRTDEPAGFRSPADYRVFDRLSDVPPHCVTDERLVIERFLPERAGGLYVLRSLHVLGDRAFAIRLAGESPVVGSGGACERTEIEPDPRILAVRAELGIDYGKLDYVLHEGEPILLDANKTTGAPAAGPGPEHRARWRERSAGIRAYL